MYMNEEFSRCGWRGMHGKGRGHGGGRGERGGERGGRTGGEGFGGGSGGGRRGGRIFGSGDLRLILLSLIGEQPRHGYELIKDIEQKFGGAYAPSPGSVYPTLTLLEEIGHIAATASEGPKKLFALTADGQAFLDDNKAMIDAVRTRMDMAARAISGQARPDAVFQAMQTLKTALGFHSGGWSEAEIERVRRIIEQAALDIESGKSAS